MSNKVEATWHPEAEATAYRCEFCTSEYSSVSALLACEQACANDRGRE